MQPLFDAPVAIRLHALCAVAALVLGAVQFLQARGSASHRLLGYIWVFLMAGVALSSFWIHEIRQWREFSVIHLLSIFVLINLPLAVLAARRHDIGQHRKAVIGMYVFGLLLAGAFTFLPGRILGTMVFGS